jgi:hypothetical protein
MLKGYLELASRRHPIKGSSAERPDHNILTSTKDPSRS